MSALLQPVMIVCSTPGAEPAPDLGADLPEPPAPGHSRDRRLLLEAAGGAEAAWREIVDTHLPAVWDEAVRACCGDAGSAAETVEMVWLALAAALGRLGAEPLDRWLARTTGEQAQRVLAAGQAAGC